MAITMKLSRTGQPVKEKKPRRDRSVPDNSNPTQGLAHARHESRDPNQPIANFRCISVAPEEA
ncbi:hypothetical protein WN51_06243 [Melipona quadrifasciata]|uniref:Uncharacterized protein n=1 Tax=Melipona quadrifasciata TaxID=166423 RepID=A0A0M8ZQ62_9HYME|nr:hypothetical protein WN51_06243 [Melipona quadrifasciata]